MAELASDAGVWHERRCITRKRPMILIGQYDSPFVRRVGIALEIYGIAFEHRPWSTFSQADLIRPYNPLVRVPTLVLDDGVVLTESHCILDYLDSLAPAGKALLPATQPARHKALRVTALATGVGEKAVSLFYEKRLHTEVSTLWVERCLAQITQTLTALESERALQKSAYWFGDSIGHADVAIACSLRFALEAHPGLIPMTQFPGLAALADRMETLPVFQQIRQPFIPPA
jgi:glutathione S-transferase